MLFFEGRMKLCIIFFYVEHKTRSGVFNVVWPLARTREKNEGWEYPGAWLEGGNSMG